MSTSAMLTIVFLLLSTGLRYSLSGDRWCKEYGPSLPVTWSRAACNRRCGYVKVDWGLGYKKVAGYCFSKLFDKFDGRDSQFRRDVFQESDMLELLQQLNATDYDTRFKFTCEKCTERACNDRRKVVHTTTTTTTSTTPLPTTPKITPHTTTTSGLGDTKSAGDYANTRTFFTILGVAALVVVLILFVSCYFTAKEQKKEKGPKVKK